MTTARINLRAGMMIHYQWNSARWEVEENVYSQWRHQHHFLQYFGGKRGWGEKILLGENAPMSATP